MSDTKRAVIFDMDGVLIDTVVIHWKLYNQLLAEYRVHIDDSELSALVGMSLDEQLPIINKKYNAEIRAKEFIQKAEELKETALSELEPKEGVVELLGQLRRAEVVTAVGTSSSSVAAKRQLAQIEVLDFFETIIGREDIEHHKPAPDVYLKAAESINVLAENCIVVEDAPNGITAAKKAGMKSIGVCSSYVKASELEGANLVVKTLANVHIDDVNKIFNTKGEN